MTRRIIAAALPHLAAEARLRREGQGGLTRPFAITARAGGALRLVSVSPAAAAVGLTPGLGLADARALCPGLITRPEAPEPLAAFRRALVRWAGQFSPLVATEGDCLILDATGCAHLFGGEAAMLAALGAGLAGLGLTARAAMADTRGGAWALAHYGGPDGLQPHVARVQDDPAARGGQRPPWGAHRRLWAKPGPKASTPGEREPESPKRPPGGGRALPGVTAGRDGGAGRAWRTEGAAIWAAPLIAPPGHTRAALAGLPVAALRLEPAEAEGLAALGLGTIEDAARIPRGALARRFGLAVLKRLDQALGAEPEPIAADRATPVFAARLTLPEPIGLTADVMAGLERLLERVCQGLEAEQRGARALRLTARRVDGADARTEIALARPGRDPARLAALFAPGVGEIEAGYGIDALRLEATATEPLRPEQTGRRAGSDQLADLISRLGNRIGFDCLARFLSAESHIPERAFTLAAAAWSEPEVFPRGGPYSGPPRPLTLFPPEPLETAPAPRVAAGAPLPPCGGGMGRGGGGLSASHDPGCDLGHPPPRFRWRGRWLTLAAAEGPERLAPEWWWDDPAWRSGTRDYWRVATAEGPRLWLFHTPQVHAPQACIPGAPRPGWWAQGAFA